MTLLHHSQWRMYFTLILITGPRMRQESLVSSVSPPSKIQVFSPTKHNLIRFPTDPHPLIKRDGSHWLQMKPISSCLTELEVQQIPVFVSPVLGAELPSSVCHMIHRLLMPCNWPAHSSAVVLESIFHSWKTIIQHFAITEPMLAYHWIYQC